MIATLKNRHVKVGSVKRYYSGIVCALLRGMKELVRSAKVIFDSRSYERTVPSLLIWYGGWVSYAEFGGALTLVPSTCLVRDFGMDSPWLYVPAEAPYLLASDHNAIVRFNSTASIDHTVHTEMYPEPFIGVPQAPVIFLGLNPGALKGQFQPPTNPILLQAYADNLRHTRTDMPFYLLNPAIGGGGYRWWTAKLRPLLQRYEERFLAQHIFSAEYFPYHSHRWSYRLPRVESQGYTYYLVQQAMERGAAIIVMRSYHRWL